MKRLLTKTVAILTIVLGLTATAQTTKAETTTSAGKKVAYTYEMAKTGSPTTVTVTIASQGLARYESLGITLPAIPGLAYDFSTLKAITGMAEGSIVGTLMLKGSDNASFSIGTKADATLESGSITFFVSKY